MQRDMLFGLYAPSPHITVGSKEITRSVKGALSPLPDGEVDPAFTLARDVLSGALPLDHLITDRIRLAEVPAAFARMSRGEGARSVVLL